MNQCRPEAHFTYSATDNLEVMTQAENYNAFLIRILKKHLAGRREILDFGAGIGCFAGQMRQLGFSVACLEPDPDHAHRLQNLGFECATSWNSFGKCRFNGAYALNVLEHIEKDELALQQLNRILVPGGILVVYVPAFPLLYSSMDRKVGHYRRYRASTLERKMREQGFRVLHCTYADVLGFVASLVFNLVGNKQGDVNPLGLKLFDRYVFPFSLFLDRFARNWLGKNLLIVGEKPTEP
jgi:SAM-dependent methyltransferase